MGKDLRKMTRQEQAAYFKSKDYCGEELKIVMDAISYGISADYLQLFEDTELPVEVMENMFTAMKEDYGVDSVSFLSTIQKGESGRIILEALKSGVPLQELKEIFRNDMLPVELREKILPLMQGREAIPEKIGEKMEFITEAVKELKESLLRQDSFIADLRKSMEEKQDIFSAPQKGAETEAEAGAADDAYYLELEEQFRQAREDAERLLEEREEAGKRLRSLEAENKNLCEQLQVQQLLITELQETQPVCENRNLQGNRQITTSPDIRNCQTMQNRQKQENEGIGTKNGKQSRFLSLFRFPFASKKPDLLKKLAGELDAGQIAEIRLGIEDGLTDGQLAILADKAMDAEKIRELRMTMKILNERGQGE